MKWVLMPFTAYMLMLPMLAVKASFLGRKSVGDNAFDEYLISLGIVLILNIFLFIRNRGFTKDSE